MCSLDLLCLLILNRCAPEHEGQCPHSLQPDVRSESSQRMVLRIEPCGKELIPWILSGTRKPGGPGAEMRRDIEERMRGKYHREVASWMGRYGTK